MQGVKSQVESQVLVRVKVNSSVKVCIRARVEVKGRVLGHGRAGDIAVVIPSLSIYSASATIDTVDVGLVFEQKDSQYLVGSCDSDYAGDLDKQRSSTSYVFTIANAPVSWKSTLQSTVALSTTEAKYMTITEAAKKQLGFKDCLESLGEWRLLILSVVL
uniref:Uncharacterized protein n=1 Tax=Solanum lycopersicum TaxID=4081 RepID=A0A3Q7EM27_SOLLC